jgi:hypothetical protein
MTVRESVVEAAIRPKSKEETMNDTPAPYGYCPIKITSGTIEVEAVSGVVREDHFLLYLTLREKHVEAESICENPAIIILRAGARTLRAIPENVNRQGGLDGANGYEKIDLSKEKSTEIELPSGWSVEVSVARYTCRIIGIRTPEAEDLISNLPFVRDGADIGGEPASLQIAKL